MADILELAPDTFYKTISDTKGLLVVYFYGPYCGHCEAFNPIFESVVSEMDGNATFAKVNMFDHVALAQYCAVRGTPTIIIYKDGKELDRQTGGEAKDAFSARIGACLTK
jgi:thioredoxin 1